MIFGQTQEELARYNHSNLRAPLLHCKINDSNSEKQMKNNSWFRQIFGAEDNYSDQVLNTSNFSQGDAFMILNPANDIKDDEYTRA